MNVIRSIRIRKEELELCLFGDDMIGYLENVRNYKINLNKKEFSKIVV